MEERETDHDGAALGVSSKELAWDNSPTTALPKGLLMDLLKHVLLRQVLKDADPGLRQRQRDAL